MGVALSGPATGTALTDAGGNYLFAGLPAGTYTVSFSPPYPGPGYAFSAPAGGSKTVVLAAGAAVTTADAGLIPTGKVGDRVWRDQNGNGLQDAGEPGINDATVNLYSYRTGTLRSTTTQYTTDGSNQPGWYEFAGLDPTDQYALQFTLPPALQLQFTAAWAGADTTPGAPAPRSEADSDADPATSWTAPFAVAPNETRTDLDAGAVPIPTSGAGVVAGIVWRDLDGGNDRDGSEPGLDRVAVHVTDPTGTTLYALTYTGPRGGYSFPSVGLVPVRVRVVAPNSLVLMDQGSDAVDSDFDPQTAMTVEPGASGPGFTPTVGSTVRRDAGVKVAPTGAVVGDRVWADWDGDGLQDAAEPGLAGASVTLRNANTGATVGTRTTDGAGYYEFPAPAAGDYQAVFALPGGYQFTRPGAGTNPAADSDPDPIGSTSPRFTVSAGVSRTDIDAGAVKTDGAAGTVAGLVWDDASETYGLREAGEVGMQGLAVDLLNGSGAVAASTVTGASGGYSFPNRPAGTYKVRVQPPRPLSPMDYGSNANDGTDSDFDPATNTTAAFSLAAGTTPIRDAGVAPRAILLAWTPDEGVAAIAKFLVYLGEGQVDPIPYAGDRTDYGDAGVTINWGDPPVPNAQGYLPEFFEEGSYIVALDSQVSGGVRRTWFAVSVGDSSSGSDETEPSPTSYPGLILSWDGLGSPTRYDVARTLRDSPGIPQLLGSTTTPGFVDETAVQGVPYRYDITAYYADGSTELFSVAATVATDPPAGDGPTPPLVQSRTGDATAADDAKAIKGATDEGKAAATKAGKVFIGVYDLSIDGRKQGNRRVVVANGSESVLPRPFKNGRGDLTYSGGYQGAVDVVKEKAKQQRATVTLDGQGNASSTLQDGTVLVASKDGDWGKLTITRVGEPVVTLRFITPIRNLQVTGPTKNTEIDRIDRMKTIVENKNATGLQLKENRNPDGSYKLTPSDWAENHIYDATKNRIAAITAATATVKQQGAQKYAGPDTAPTPAELRAIKEYVFEIKGDWPELVREVDKRVQRLRTENPGYTFTAKHSVQ
ncbi:MAG: carboxypeptidase regulatory-like domain-containing protein [Gemmataceae bacterium]|nr:carboxypeptidase regulatory-like domain-containing protein [Gemmataceae bacterium]